VCRLEIPAGADTELEAPAAQQIQRCRRLGEYGGRPQRQVGDVGEDAHGLRLGQDRGEQRGGVEKPSLVGAVLDTDQVVAESIEQPGGLEQAGRVVGVRRVEVAELEWVPVVQSLVRPLWPSFGIHCSHPTSY
jgi:hypothetical protein